MIGFKLVNFLVPNESTNFGIKTIIEYGDLNRNQIMKNLYHNLKISRYILGGCPRTHFDLKK